mmetsp:Transcript_11011/g.26985  ORF Transcript_11011/g.26985 Transcript_11011/m.26985 type:complete len:924 (+) Transcript_11011:137-2908(+)
MSSKNLSVAVPSSPQHSSSGGDTGKAATTPPGRGSSWKGGDGKAAATDWQAKRRTNAKFESLGALTVVEARELRGRTAADAVRKQEEVRELVGSRYSDFIDAADTISNMRTSAHHILETAAVLHDLSKKLVGGAWINTGKRSQETKSRGWAADASTVLQTSELVHSSIDSLSYLAAARQLLRGRALYASLSASENPAVAEWRDIPFVKLQASALVSPSLPTAVVSAAQVFLRGALPDDGTQEAKVADALASISLVKTLTVRDAMDLFLEARAACTGGLCKELSGGAASEQQGHEGLLQAMCALKSCLVHTVEAAFALFATSQGKEGEDVPLLIRLLGSVEECHLRGDLLKGIPRDDCAKWCAEWVKAQAAAVRASSRAGLQAIPSGQELAAIESSLMGKSDQDLVPEGAWGQVASTSPWMLLFAEAFGARVEQVVLARFGDMQVVPLIESSIEALVQPGSEAAFALKSADSFFAARTPMGLVDGKVASHPWDTLSNNSGAQFLSQLHAAVSDCHGLILSASQTKLGGKASVREERLLLLQESCKKAVAGLASFLQAKCQALKAKVGREGHGLAVAQAMYLSQCAVTVRKHLQHLLEMLSPVSAKGGGKEAASEKLVQELTEILDGVRDAGHGMWVDWVALNGKKELLEGLKALEAEGFWQSGDELIRRWEEVDVSMESESGEVRSDRLPVPASALPHTFTMLFKACSQVLHVTDPPLGNETLRLLANKMAVATVEAYEQIPKSVLQLSDQMCVQLLFDFGLAMDILAGHSEKGLASRVEKVESVLTASLDPIDWSFQQNHVDASRARAYQRACVVMGPLVQLRRLHLRAATAHSSLPKPINILPLATPQQRFGLLPAVDAWSVHATDGEGGDGGAIGDDLDSGVSSGTAWQGEKVSPDGQALTGLRGFGSYFGQQVAKGWAGF